MGWLEKPDAKVRMDIGCVANQGVELLYFSCNNNNGRNGSCLTWLATSLEEKRRWLIINASPRGQCSK